MEKYLQQIIKSALEEDIGSGDITTKATIGNDVKANGKFLVKDDGMIAGLEVAEKVFQALDEEIRFSNFVADGTQVKKGTIIAEVEGKAAPILTGERTALNFLQRMSGIATLTNRFVEKVKHSGAKILDTRKTVPGLRLLDKEAVRLGGGKNHRIGLFDLYLIKDNHIEVAGSITNAVMFCKELQQKNKTSYKIEVETKNLNEVEEALNCNVDLIMLDNFNTDIMREAVMLINKKCLVEASGNINLDNVAQVAETGIDYISVGALTHSVKALDISLEVELIR